MNQELKAITIKDIAKMTGLSICTVSRAITNNGSIAVDTRKKVLKAIKETGYSPNAIARSLIKKSSNIIGIIVSEINNPFMSGQVVIIEHILRKAGYSIQLCNSEFEFDKALGFVTELIEWKAKGLVCISTEISENAIDAAVKDRYKIVTNFTKMAKYDYICVTEWKGSYDLTEYLIKLGHKRIAYVGFQKKLGTTLERLKGYQDALFKYKIPLRENYLIHHEIYDEGNIGYYATKKLLSLDEPPTAIVFINDFCAIHGYYAIEETGLHVGDDISVAGFDDIEIAKIIAPGLTTVKYDKHKMAVLTAETLLDSINNEQKTKNIGINLPTEIVIRGSTKPPSK